MKKMISIFTFMVLILLALPVSIFGQERNFPEGSSRGRTNIEADNSAGRIPFINFDIREPRTNREVAFSIQLLLLLTLIAIAPSLLLLMTSFLRISIVLDFIKRALSLQQVPPTQVLNGIALFLTLFIMWPVFNEVYTNSFKPMADGEINIETAYTEAEKPIRLFMYKQMAHDSSYITLCMSMAKLPKPNTLADVPTHILIPAFILHELTIAFQIGIFLYLPFIIIDMVVASILMSMGMIMLPPVQISMPFKLILFVLVDGWNLLIGQLFYSFL
ncbi:flagellar biosynthetic protein FliP [Treponema phagedenis]|uniref:Flagellar biosynthetic protein FliP n=1 Tax=Treponema phagedenis TaxID=162 RepID=A0A0B7H260_TREPH|nr:flagellar type III secretion system pore protein FliP [Treponema phagedenis]NVP24123.1 flagellar type III secretion system pore protein FliP [Treponema phagedenis]QEJ96263.1 flagellar type III secretion system pore protein FliP [Treponema phagedenis]QEJ99314.1 flagellar type III secretion system pore protein FliP [Treponema phagedenis]QEK00041.1 flagellar type III secretion system pore protein FliP [Treponema phagedenis]QEK04885.1 flagellar type III secretion system pore protein FliP [Trepo